MVIGVCRYDYCTFHERQRNVKLKKIEKWQSLIPCVYSVQMGPKAETKAAKPKAAAAKPAAKKQTETRMVKKTIGGDKNGGSRLVKKTRTVI